MPVKLNGSTSGSVTLAAPATGTDVTLTLPTTALATTASVTSAVAPMGLVAVAPTSIANSGGSASLSNYTVSFSGVSSISLNGCFTGDYDNYRMLVSVDSLSTGVQLYFRMRLAGADNSSAQYNSAYVEGYSGGTVGGTSTGQTQGQFSYSGTNAIHACEMSGPALAKPTGFVTTTGRSTPTVVLFGGRHNVSTAYDGITLYPNSGTMTGSVSVFGYKK